MPFDGSDFRKLRNMITSGAYAQPEEASGMAMLVIVDCFPWFCSFCAQKLQI
jgi:hypothetical protein